MSVLNPQISNVIIHFNSDNVPLVDSKGQEVKYIRVFIFLFFLFLIKVLI